MIAWSIAMMFNLSLSLPILTGFLRECPDNAARAMEEQSFREFITGLSDREARKLSGACGAKRRSSARSANARATPGWQASHSIFPNFAERMANKYVSLIWEGNDELFRKLLDVDGRETSQKVRADHFAGTKSVVATGKTPCFFHFCVL